MKYFTFSLLILIFAGGINSTSPAQTSCINCHQQLEAEPTENMANDSHFKNDVTCVDCHGGDADPELSEDMEAAMNPAKGYIGVPVRGEIPKLCANCHSDASYIKQFDPNLPVDQYQQYQTSQHGQLLAEGDTKVAVCIDCHGTHDILPATSSLSKVYPTNIPGMCGTCHSDPEYMKPYRIPVNQQELYRKSVHGINLFEQGDRSAPVCNDCHGNHGAIPPGVASISHVCGICHVSQFEMFEQSPHEEAFAEMEVPQCEFCHGNHDIQPTRIEMLGTGSESLCTHCHDEDSKGYSVAHQMREQADSLLSKINLADSLLTKAERAGVLVSEGEFTLTDARNALTKARSVVHYFSLEKFNEAIEPGLDVGQQAVEQGRKALSEVQNRRLWLASISIIIFITAISLYFKIKMLKK